MASEWSNWSGNVRCAPARVAAPADEASICALVREAGADGLSVRVAGTGHSFTPLVATDGVLVSLDRWTGLESYDAASGRATVRAGTKLHDLGAELFARGLAMENLGDVDVQSVAGAISTGTHGTGPTLGNLSTHVVGMRLVTASGAVLDLTDAGGPISLAAARVSLGVLGIISAVTLRLQPAYCLHERVWREPGGACLDQLADRVAANTRFEFFWFPLTDEAECKTLNPTDLPPDTDAPSTAPPTVMAGAGAPFAVGAAPRAPVERERVGWSAAVIPSVRERKFNEMEYALPAAAGPDCFRLLQTRMRQRHPEVAWPVEYRTLAADDAWLSPAFGRETVTISVHQDVRLPFHDFFGDVEAIFRDHEGRPHWGKIHTRTAAELRDLYPRWGAFLDVRARRDPRGRFLTPYLRGLFGAGGAA